MRFLVNINLIDNNIPYSIPTDYRRHVSSLIKEAINIVSKDIYEDCFGKRNENKSKPYTFSLQIPNARIKNIDNKNQFITNVNRLTLHFSSNNYLLLNTIYNGLLEMRKGKNFRLFGYKISISNFYLKLEQSINSDNAFFRTLSPVVIRNIDDKKGVGYLTFSDNNFKDMMFYSIENIAKNFISRDYVITKDMVKIDFTSAKVVKIFHYGELIPAFDGKISIKAPVEILNLIYDVGLGARRNQGFGMLNLEGTGQ